MIKEFPDIKNMKNGIQKQPKVLSIGMLGENIQKSMKNVKDKIVIEEQLLRE